MISSYRSARQPVGDIYDYMGALANYAKGDKAIVKVKRKDQVLEKEVEF